MSNNNENPKIEVRDMRDSDWLWTHKAVLFSRHISASDFKVYCGLASYANNHHQQSWPSLLTLAQKLNLSKSTVVRALKILEACNVIRVERRDGTSNLYSLLKCESDIMIAPLPVPKDKSPHHQLIQFFHETTIQFRGIKPIWDKKDTKRLKDILTLGLIDNDKIEQLMLFFLAAPRFKKFSPSMSVFFSAGIFNGLMNAMKNDTTFWKEMNQYQTQLGRGKISNEVRPYDVSKMLKQLTDKMTIQRDAE